MKNRGLLLLVLLIVINMFYLHLREEGILNETVSLAMGLCIGACWGAVLAYLSMKLIRLRGLCFFKVCPMLLISFCFPYFNSISL
jgi:hypothetical protein